jgi:dihydrofolate reductase
MNSLPKVVVSRTLDRAGWNNTKLVKENAVQEISKLKQQSSKDIFVFGSANLSATLMQHNLFDEYRLCLVPVVLGKGKPLFAQGLSQRKLNLQDERRLKSGSILLYYVPEM